MNEQATTPDDNRELFARLREMWAARDPMPEGLVDDILVRLATEDLGTEYALLTLVSDANELAGVRGLSDNHTLEFSDGVTTVLLRVSSAGVGKRRVDGWLAPASSASLRIETEEGETSTVAGEDGRFAFADVVGARARIWLDGVATADAPVRRGFTTLEFDL